jgi:hypothetical protein
VLVDGALARRADYEVESDHWPVTRAAHVATHVATPGRSPSVAPVRTARDVRKDNSATFGERPARDYGSEGWGFDSLRAR